MLLCSVTVQWLAEGLSGKSSNPGATQPAKWRDRGFSQICFRYRHGNHRIPGRRGQPNGEIVGFRRSAFGIATETIGSRGDAAGQMARSRVFADLPLVSPRKPSDPGAMRPAKWRDRRFSQICFRYRHGNHRIPGRCGRPNGEIARFRRSAFGIATETSGSGGDAAGQMARS